MLTSGPPPSTSSFLCKLSEWTPSRAVAEPASFDTPSLVLFTWINLSSPSGLVTSLCLSFVSTPQSGWCSRSFAKKNELVHFDQVSISFSAIPVSFPAIPAADLSCVHSSLKFDPVFRYCFLQAHQASNDSPHFYWLKSSRINRVCSIQTSVSWVCPWLHFCR